MGFRFRKSFKIAPGIKLNIGKKGFSSISVGKTNFGSRGVHTNFNIPGTGISYRSQLSGGSKKRPVQSSSQHKIIEMAFTAKLWDNGTIYFVDRKGKPLSDVLVKTAIKQNRDGLLSWLGEQCDEFNAEIESLQRIHLMTPAPSGGIIVNPKPKPPKKKALGLMAHLFSSQRQKTDEKNLKAQQEYQTLVNNWERAEKELHSNPDVMSEVLSNAFASIEWPRETTISFEIVDNGSKAMLDVDLPEIEDMPILKARVVKRDLKLVKEERSFSQIQFYYLTHIHAIAFRLIGEVFAFLPSISVVVFSGFSQRIDKKIGKLNDEYLYSVRVHREKWEQINFQNLEHLDVVSCFGNFELIRSINGKGIISAIEPYQG